MDFYSKTVLTVIAVALVGIAARGLSPLSEAVAQTTPMCNASQPCWVKIDSESPLRVCLTNDAVGVSGR